MNQEACSFDDKEAVTLPAEIDMLHDIGIIDVCSVNTQICPRICARASESYIKLKSEMLERSMSRWAQMFWDKIRFKKKKIQSCLTDATLNKGMVHGARAGFGEMSGLSWAGDGGPYDHESHLPYPWLTLMCGQYGFL